MNHPSREQWLAHLYADEADAAETAPLREHLASCPECRDRVESWRSVLGSLDQWEIAPLPAEPTRRRSNVVRIAAIAAALVALLAVGFMAGRQSSASKAEVAALRQQLGQLTAGLDQRMQQVAAAESAKQLKPVSAAVREELHDLRTEQTANYLSLRKELETVAVFTAASFRQTESSLVQLANNSAPADPRKTIQ
jgi:anti-sigma factor RsiW